MVLFVTVRVPLLEMPPRAACRRIAGDGAVGDGEGAAVEDAAARRNRYRLPEMVLWVTVRVPASEMPPPLD